MRHIYLDYNATTPIAPAAQEAMLPFLAEHYGNPSSSHALGRACHEAVEDARARVANMLGADRSEIVFTSSGSEANNLAIKGLAWKKSPQGMGHLVISAIEHPAVTEPVRFLERWGYDVTVVSVTDQGIVPPAAVEAALRPDTMLVSVMLANNEIGTIQPLRDIVARCRERGVPVHSDAAQAVGKIPVEVTDLGVDLLSIAGHKFYAPKGVGALYVRRGTALESLVHGAGHEAGMRAGTENVPHIVAMGQAASLVRRNLSEVQDHLAMLHDRLYRRLRKGVGDALSVNGRYAQRLPNTLSVNFPGVMGGELLRRIPELCASTGAACHSASTQITATLSAIGLPLETARGTVRLSVGWYTTPDDVDRAADLLIAAWEDLQ